MSKNGIIEHFKSLKIINEEQIKKCKEYSEKYSIPLLETIFIRNYIDKREFLKLYARYYKIPFMEKLNIESLPTILPERFLRERRVIPIKIENNTIKIAIDNPFNINVIKDIEFITGLKSDIVLTMPQEIERIIKKVIPQKDFNNSVNDLSNIIQNNELKIIDKKDNIENLDLQKIASQPPIVRLVNIIFIDAIHKRATDIHIEPQKDYLLIRFRIDGYLQEYIKLDKQLTPGIVSRLKIISKMNIAERRKAQDGSLSISIDNKEIDMRINTLPSLYGEKVVIRILDKSNIQIEIEKLGLLSSSLSKIYNMIKKPYGIIFVCGPTGSGKTTTLYSLINHLKSKDKNIVTIEDPIEYKLSNITQVQVDEKGGITFPSALRAILRQDPDIILIGEIRDNETAKIAVQAAQTGHLVFATLHTNNSIGVISRLKTMGIDMDLILNTVIGVISQRLVRKICPYCAKEEIISNDKMKLYSIKGEPFIQKKGTGCYKCNNLKYRGRTVIEEILEINYNTKELFLHNYNDEKLQTFLMEKGFKPMSIIGMEKVLNHITTIEELSKVVDLTNIQVEKNKVSFVDNYIKTNIKKKKGNTNTIMIVDDSITIRMMIKPLLEGNGFKVIEAENGKECVQYLKNQYVDLILLDLMMPELNGFETIKILKNNPEWKNIPIIMLTTKSELENEMKGFELGIDEFMPKPFMPERLLARIKAILKRK